MQRIVEALIAKGRRTNKPSEQRDVALSLADISCKSASFCPLVLADLNVCCAWRTFAAAEDSGSRTPALVERIVTKGGVKTLLHLLVKSQDIDAQRFSALALANCASAREFPEPTAAPCDFPPRSPPNTHTPVARSLSRTHVSVCAGCNCARIAAEGAIEVVIAFIFDDENDIIARQYCAMALGNLAAEPETHVEIVKCNGA